MTKYRWCGQIVLFGFILFLANVNSAFADKLVINSASIQPSIFSPQLGGAIFNIDVQVDKCCGLGGGANFAFYVRWNLSIDNGIRVFTGQNQILPNGTTIPHGAVSHTLPIAQIGA
jgi:hypothetical protein